eukprot:1597460-Rhodomonas_salina.1
MYREVAGQGGGAGRECGLEVTFQVGAAGRRRAGRGSKRSQWLGAEGGWARFESRDSPSLCQRAARSSRH